VIGRTGQGIGTTASLEPLGSCVMDHDSILAQRSVGSGRDRDGFPRFLP
jgi:hypothetical protein